MGSLAAQATYGIAKRYSETRRKSLGRKHLGRGGQPAACQTSSPILWPQASKSASLKESRPVESRVIIRKVVCDVGGNIVAGIPASRGDVLLDNGRLCLVDFS